LFLKNKDRTLAQIFNSSFRYIDEVLSLNNTLFGDYLHRIYSNELEVKDTTDTQKCASCLVLYLEIDNRGRLNTKLYDKRHEFTFSIVIFPFISSNIPASPAYGVYISQLIRYSRACVQYSDFLDRTQLLTQKLLKQGEVAPRLKSSLHKFYVVITIWLIFFYVDVFLPALFPILLPDLTVYISSTAGVL
jgi:hypothetical protein